MTTTGAAARRTCARIAMGCVLSVSLAFAPAWGAPLDAITAEGASAANVALNGTVRDSANAPITGATLRLEGPAGMTPRSTTTNEVGEFALRDLTPGLYRLSATRDGFERYATELRLSGAETSVSVVLAPAVVRSAIVVTEDAASAPVVSATKMLTPPLDLPQSVSTVSSRILQEQVALSMNEALRNVPGVSAHMGEGRRDQALIRGFTAINDQYIDGVRDDALYYRDLSNVESVEVLKGPAAVLFGRGSSGGIINRVTKKPYLNEQHGSARVLAGSYDARRGDGDISVPLMDSRLAARLAGAYEDSGSFRDYFNLHRYTVSPSVLWRPDSVTSLLVQGDYLRDDRTPDRGIPSYNGAPANVRLGAYYGYPQEDYMRNRVSSIAVTGERRFGEQWTVRDLFRATTYRNDFSNTFANSTSLVNGQLMVARGQYNSSGAQGNVFNQLESVYAWHFAGITQQILTGFEYGHQSRDTMQYTGTASTVPLINPVLTRPVYSTALSTYNTFTGDVAGLYVQDQISWRSWRALIGVRRDWYEQTLDNRLPNSVDLNRTDRAWSPRYGLVYRPTTWASIYTSYSKSFSPSGEGLSLAVNNAQLKPEQTRNLEAGVKSELLNQRLTTTVSVFRLDRTNIKTTDPNNPLLLVLVGAQRTDGVELSFAGAVTRRLNVNGGYAFFDPVIRRSNTVTGGVLTQGNIPAMVPKRSGNLWATYRLTRDFSLGAGVFQASRRFAGNDDVVTLPGYVRFDGALFYRHGRWNAQLNFRNLLNRDYYETAHTNSQIMPGVPVNGALTVGYRW